MGVHIMDRPFALQPFQGLRRAVHQHGLELRVFVGEFADDAEREWGAQDWDKKSAEYTEKGFTPVSMKTDFAKIYEDGVTKADEQFHERGFTADTEKAAKTKKATANNILFFISISITIAVPEGARPITFTISIAVLPGILVEAVDDYVQVLDGIHPAMCGGIYLP